MNQAASLPLSSNRTKNSCQTFLKRFAWKHFEDIEENPEFLQRRNISKQNDDLKDGKFEFYVFNIQD